ncbi:MAG: UvrD-helicase domain-containing protein, partial [Ilumatobacter sp.]
MTARPEPVDQADRELISRSGLGSTLFVEAGAGTGKTTQLVDRIVNTVLERDVSLVDIAAITFTEAAASELQARIRIAFERRVADESTTHALRERCRQAIVDADRASISTVHGFASRILSEFAIAARLPPRVTALDEVSSQLAHERRWERFVDRLHGDPANEELLYRAAVLDVPLTERYSGQGSFKQVAAAFAQNWDRLVDIDLGAAGEPLVELDFSSFESAIDALESIAATCKDPTDKLIAHIEEACLPSMREVAAIADPYRKLRLFASGLKWSKAGGGKKDNWDLPPIEVRGYIGAVNEAVVDVCANVTSQVVERLWRLTAQEVLAAARSRRNDGGLEFHDLLVLARTVLRDSSEVRRSLHERYRHILLDEFQDTDPIQIEVASLIAAEPSDEQPLDWREHVVPDGGLFFVGDPKQSIYRFRRADIELFLSARAVFGDATDAGGGPVRLTTNFRTVGPIIEWVNELFAVAMPEEIAGAQPRYEPLHAWREPEVGNDHRPIVFGGAHPDPKVKATPLREAEASDVASIVAHISARPHEWPVWSESDGAWRPARLDDVTILIPTRTSLPYLREALDGAAVPYRLATGTLVYDTQEVRDALALLRAVDDPGDTLSLITALRSPLYGCSDVDLATYHRAHRSWSLRAAPQGDFSADHPAAAAIGHLHSLWSQRWWMSPATLLERALRERRAFLVGLGDPRPAEVWRRLRFLLDQARMFEESVGGDLRSFLDWAALQSADGARVHEPLLPETDESAARQLAGHGAKGRGFPSTTPARLTTQASSARRGASA